jgi:hypothetical protein
MGEPPDLALPILGGWTLAAWTGMSGSGRPVDHGGPNLTGDLIYLRSGRMAVQIQHDGRTPLGSRELDAGTEELQAAAFRTYIAYAGRFSIPEPGIVIHHVEQSLRPDQVGMDKHRPYDLDGDDLVLQTEPVRIEGELADSTLRWRRADLSGK